IDVKNASKDFEEISKKQKSIQQEMYEKYLEKIKLKKQIDEAISNYTKCIEQYNNLCSKERDILIEKQQSELKLIEINKINTLNNNVLKRFNDLNGKLRTLIEENEKWKENKWNELEQKWSKWNSQEIAIFIGHTLECQKSKLNQFHDIIKKNKIDAISLLNLSKTDLMSIFNFETFSQACTIRDSFTEICKKHPIDMIDSDKDVRRQYIIPKEFICPLSKSIMKDPVIASNGITYDRSSIINQYQNIPDYSSLMTNEKLELFSDLSLKQKIERFLKNSK
ncbi:hypothetical protein RFI_33175, partial [Reticulomyxa filosa]